MYAVEVRSLAGLALLYSFRMLGLFMVLPVLALYASDYPGATPLMVGVALGIYGIFQSILQIPFGLMSDKIGRKPVIVFGMMLFLAGSLVAASAETIQGVIVGRALQGTGAVASTIMAMLSDLTREEIRVRAMATIGGMIGVSFAVAMILGPWVANHWGVPALFEITAVMAAMGVAVVLWVVPTPEASRVVSSIESLAVPSLIATALKNTELLRLNVGIFTLHLVQMACWVSVPVMLESVFEFDRASHWWLYLATMGGGFLLMIPFVIIAEKYRKMKPVFLGAILTLVVAEGLLLLAGDSFAIFVTGLVVFFIAFNLLEATLPSLVSKNAPSGSRGTAMGVYSSSQFLGVFVGGVFGGWLAHHYGLPAVFVLSAVVSLFWLLIAASMPVPRHWSSLVVEYDGKSTVDSRYLVDQVAGLEDVVVLPDQGLLYLKVEKAQFDKSRLENILGRPINS